MHARSLRTQLAVRAGRATAALSRKLGRGGGSVIGGRVTLALDPLSLERLAVGRRIALVSGTNGKTTTTAMLAAALRASGEVATNVEGANMFGGMVSALSSSRAQVAALEVDEGHLPRTLSSTGAEVVVLLNLSRDQLDRVGEVRMQAQRWREALDGSAATVVANADDPLVVWAAGTAKLVAWVAGGASWKLDAASCPACGARIDWSGDAWACTSCDLCRPSHLGGDVGDVEVPDHLAMPGEVNRRNAAMALTAAALLGADLAAGARAVAELRGAEGRFSEAEIAGVPVRLLLAKNPAGWTEALRIARPEARSAIIAINARVQDGRDPSWLWDVPFEQLHSTFVVATGERGRDLAVRLRYAGVSHVMVDDLKEAVRQAALRGDGEVIDVLGNYSAFQDFRKVVDR